jgi:hypothetical protein
MTTETSRDSSNGAGPEAAARAAAGAVNATSSLAQMAGRLIAAVAEQAQRRVPSADLDERDPDYIRETLPGLWLLASLYFRADVRGLQNIPEEGPGRRASRSSRSWRSAARRRRSSSRAGRASRGCWGSTACSG